MDDHDAVAPARGAVPGPAGPSYVGHVADDRVDERPAIVDWGRTARRMRWLLAVLSLVVVLAWLGVGFAGDGPSLGLLGELVGFALLAAIAGEVVIVGGSALRGMLTAGARGERLASADVSLLPPQLTRRRRR